jgi:hypothetical protein
MMESLFAGPLIQTIDASHQPFPMADAADGLVIAPIRAEQEHGART